MQYDVQTCSFTRAAYSLQTAIRRAEYTSENVRKFAGKIDSSFEGTHCVAAETLKECARIERDLKWVRDLFIYAAENTSFAEKLRELTESAGLSTPLSPHASPPAMPPARRQREGAVPAHWKIPPFGAALSTIVGKSSARA